LPKCRRQVKNDLVLGASLWPVFTRPSLAAFHLTAEAIFAAFINHFRVTPAMAHEIDHLSSIAELLA
jgi:hypothetical protein